MARILVMDDSILMRKFARQALEGAGYEVDEAADGALGIKRLDAAPADLVITDMFMPNREGLETIRELRKRFPEVKILAISGGGNLGREDVLFIARKLGAHGTLGKPFQSEELLEAVKGLLARPVP